MINKLISKSQVSVLNCENCPNEDYAEGYVRAISDVLDLEPIPTLGVDTLEKIRAEVEELKVVCGCQYEDEREVFDWAVDEALEIIGKHIGGKDK